jgi:glycosyltransferase involved in cell wall biosynthesis
VYFQEKVVPYLNDTTVVYMGNVGPVQRNQLLGNAKALLHPINFEEPFGLSVAEAMMCGTPVIAFNRGSMNELIKNRETGYLVQNIAEAVLATRHIKLISRKACRAHAINKFSSHVMASHYMQLYEKIVRKQNGL